MSVNTQHDVHKRLMPVWRKVRDCVEGARAVKEAGDTYLPRLGGQESTEYDAYKERATFFEATKRTRAGLVGAVFRKDPIIEASDKVREEFLESVTKDVRSLDIFAKHVLKEVLMTAKLGVLIDMPEEAEEPTFVSYVAESIINWKKEIIDGKEKWAMLVFEEESEARGVTEFDVARGTQYLVLDLFREEEGAKAKYRVRRFEKSDSTTAAISSSSSKSKEGDRNKIGDFVQIGEDSFPTVKGKPWEEIPFVMITAEEEEDDEDPSSPLEGIAELNVSHYRSSADLEHGRHWTALPTPWITGVEKGPKLKIGSQTAWTIPDSEAEVGMLEFTGEGLKSLVEALKEKQEQMAVLGARLLEEEKRGVEAADTHKLRKVGENSVLASVAKSVAKGINRCLEFATIWDGTLGEMTIELNTDYGISQIETEMLKTLLLGIQGGKISFETFYYNMQRGEMYPEDHTEEDERDAIQTDKDEEGAGGEEDAMDLDEGEDEEEGEVEGGAKAGGKTGAAGKGNHVHTLLDNGRTSKNAGHDHGWSVDNEFTTPGGPDNHRHKVS